MTTTTSEHTYWRDKLANKPAVLTNEVQSGFYRGSWFKDSGVLPIAIWRTPDGEQKCLVGYSEDAGKEPKAFFGKPDTVEERWTFFCTDVISYKLYSDTFRTGNPWPETPTVEKTKFDHNQPPTGLDLHKHELKDLIDSTRLWLKIDMTDRDKEWADKAANYRSLLLDKKKVVDKEREAKKAPHMKAGNAIQAEYKPVVDEAEKWNKLCRDEIGKWQTEQEREAKQKFIEEAAATAAAVAAGEKDVDDVVIPKPIAAVGGRSTGGTGRATAFRTMRKAEITNYKTALAFFSTDPAISNMVQSLADAKARGGDDKGPGWKLVETQVAS